MCSTAPSGAAAVRADRVFSTRRWTGRQMNERSRLATSAPGSSPASHSTWKPLQMPITGAPTAASSVTGPITGEKRAIAPVRR